MITSQFLRLFSIQEWTVTVYVCKWVFAIAVFGKFGGTFGLAPCSAGLDVSRLCVKLERLESVWSLGVMSARLCMCMCVCVLSIEYHM
jgi:hypothetical protein